MALIFFVILIALVFEYINGFHDTANAIATSISTKVMTPAQAIVMSAVFNLIGALAGTAVAKTVGIGLVDSQFVTLTTVLCALLGAIIWNLATWWVGLPSSSSHALIGGLCGAALASAQTNWHAIIWYQHTRFDPVTQRATELSFGKATGLWPKVIFPMIAAPVGGIVIGFLFMALLYLLLGRWKPQSVNAVFGKSQLLSAAWMSFSHGTNDAQKTMGIITLTLFTATAKGQAFANLPDWLSFLRTPEFHIAMWVKVVCAFTMAAGTAAGGWRIIRTMGRQLVKLQPVHGFAAQTTAAAIIETASHWGIPLSTTHVISSSIMGVGSARRFNAVKWTVVERMVWAWIMTLPVTGLLSYLVFRMVQLLGWS